MVSDLLIDADYEVDVKIERRNATTRNWEAATGLSGVAARIAASPSGTALGSCTVNLTEAGTTGRYVGVLDTGVLVSALAAYENRKVYLVASKSGDFDRIVGELIVQRRAGM